MTEWWVHGVLSNLGWSVTIQTTWQVRLVKYKISTERNKISSTGTLYSEKLRSWVNSLNSWDLGRYKDRRSGLLSDCLAENASPVLLTHEYSEIMPEKEKKSETEMNIFYKDKV